MHSTLCTFMNCLLLLIPTMASADFLLFVVTTKSLVRPHGVRLISFISYARHIYVYSLLYFGSRTLLCLANSSQLYPPNVIRVPRAETLLTTSFRFYLTIDTLVVQLVLYYRSRTRDFHSLDINHARHTQIRGREFPLPLINDYLYCDNLFCLVG